MHTICEMMQEALDRLIEEREFYKARMKQYKRMAKLWKRCAKNMRWLCGDTEKLWKSQYSILEEELDEAETRAEKAEAELEALKNDARLIVESAMIKTSPELMAANRILAATEENE